MTNKTTQRSLKINLISKNSHNNKPTKSSSIIKIKLSTEIRKTTKKKNTKRINPTTKNSPIVWINLIKTSNLVKEKT